MKRKPSRYPMAIAIMMGAAGTLAVSTSPITITEAHAFGLGDITGAAKKVGGAVKKGAKKAGGAVKKVAVPVAKVVAAPQRLSTNMALKSFGEVVLKPHAELTIEALKAIGKGEGFDQPFKDDLYRDYNKWLDADQLVRAGAGAAKKAGKKVGKVIIGRNQIGGSLPRPDKTKAENALLDFANGNLRPTRNGRARAPQKTITFKPGIAGKGAFLHKDNEKDIGRKNRRFPANQPMTIILPNGQLGNDKSVWGRPVGGIKSPAKGMTGKTTDRRKSFRVNKRQQLRLTLPNEQAKKNGGFLRPSKDGKTMKQRSRNNDRRLRREKRRSNQRLSNVRLDNRKSGIRRKASTDRARFSNKMLSVKRSAKERRLSKHGRRR